MTDLFILVGTNPLPCYVSAVYLKNYYRECRLYLICSQDNEGIKQAGTFEIGKRIKDQLIKHNHFKKDDFAKLVEIGDVSSKSSIESALKPSLEGCEKIHLNYTGGTKSMAALSYELLMSCEDKQFSSSYLDGRRNIMIIDGETAGDDKDDLRRDEALALDLETLSLLHDMPKTGDKDRSDEYDDLLEELVSMLDEDKLSDIYGSSSFDCEVLLNSEKLEKATEQQTLIEENVSKLIQNFRPDSGTKAQKKLKKYIDGPWLEHYVHRELLKLEPGFNLYFDVQKRIEEEDHFQLDIVAIYGYQITLISITTGASKGLCKLKAFEAIYRAQQLGGDEAKTIMVTLMKHPESLILDLERSYGSFVPGFTAFGIDDLRNKSIFESIINHIKE
ncbi:MAG: DUF1887 family CARF protein [Candidatus Cloacimonetes bacterium]|jgi:hypothetical protein|nr:DUF1887 family CARF protein [Candidatus Cloacimonadota bacterium]MCB5288016.1 DUF1887 family CARF protein [Candidatus Cloacimonadota bacterium]MCK9185099.1 DUF1887 family CARF protein [Candidatus Cloacimonadota bacterium]MCK9583971.1 DUF1887 family CARF protein [Candidatus Cloacimonadota bacterium]MDY0230339.1 DUF1887 family CARF protein [Candidatus Cloacimonadaceae bacterium]